MFSLLALCPGIAAGVEVDEAAIARCAAIAEAEARIRCLEDALRESAAEPGSGVATSGDLADAADRLPVAGSGSDAARGLVIAPAGNSETAESAKVPVPNTTADGNTDSPEPGQADPRGAGDGSGRGIEEFGLPANRTEQGSRESIMVKIVSVGQTAYGKSIFHTANGQVWRQIDSRTPRYPGKPFDAEIRAAAAGSFFIRPASGGISVRVRREH